MIFENIYKDIVSSFGEIWTYKERGKSLEIITPFATSSQKFISVFLTEREGKYIVSDGGWIMDGVYEVEFALENKCFLKIYEHYLDSFNIKKTVSSNTNNSRYHFYKTNEKAT